MDWERYCLKELLLVVVVADAHCGYWVLPVAVPPRCPVGAFPVENAHFLLEFVVHRFDVAGDADVVAAVDGYLRDSMTKHH